jgi:hypothetical protein
MKAYQHELAHLYERRKTFLRFSSGSLFQSLITASVIGILVAVIAVALNSVRWHGSAWYVSTTAAALLEGIVVTALVTIVIQGRRKRAIRRTLELAFLNHHIRNSDEHVAAHCRPGAAGTLCS